MISTAQLARPTGCLRCQLRRVLLQSSTRGPAVVSTGATNTRCQPFSCQSLASQELVQDRVKRRSDYGWKHVHPHGRIVGRPGRRQRVVSERLATDSLSKPSNVVLFHDVDETSATSQDHSVESQYEGEGSDNGSGNGTILQGLLTPQEIEDAVTTSKSPPAEGEVNASLDAMQPASSILDEVDFAELTQKLVQGYNLPQLSRYLARFVQPAISADDGGLSRGIQDLATSHWRRGETSLAKRHAYVMKKKGATTKKKVAEQILRLAWNITIQTEEQEVGELECQLQPWQSSMLFDLAVEGQPNYQILVDSQLLVNASKVDLHRPTNIMRISARRHDAEEIVRRLKLTLLQVKKIIVNLDTFKPMLGSAGWPQQLNQLFREEDLAHVSALTRSVLKLEEGNNLAIYNPTYEGGENARRLILSFLHLPRPMSQDLHLSASQVMVPRGTKVKSRRQTVVPADDLASGLHSRWIGTDLVRMATPIPRNSRIATINSYEQKSAKLSEGYGGNEASSARRSEHKLGGALARRLGAMKCPSRDQLHGLKDHSYWQWDADSGWSQWAAEFCKILQPADSKDSQGTPSKRLSRRSYTNWRILQHHVPGIESLLTYFEAEQPRLHPTSDFNVQRALKSWRAPQNHQGPLLVAHFLPSPFTADGIISVRELPRIEMHFNLGMFESLSLSAIRAKVEEQALSVSLPNEAVDIRFHRGLTMIASIEDAKKDPEIEHFTNRLQETAKQRNGNALNADAELAFKLPSWLVHPEGSQGLSEVEAVTVPYLFERFEQIQRSTFMPTEDDHLLKRLGEEDRLKIQGLWDAFHLEHCEIDAGAVGGRMTTLSLSSLPNAAGNLHSVTSHSDEDQNEARPSQEIESEFQDARENKDLPEGRIGEITNTALGIAHLLTQATSGMLGQELAK